MPDWPAILWSQTWWRYEAGGDSPYNEPYHWFNIAEAVAWFVFAALVMWRWNRVRSPRGSSG